jgi:putative FmdB family regulatory protein
MPTYDYGCSDCGHRFEVFEGISAKGFRGCPKCGQEKARRLLSTGSGVIFKGTGFYTTDYKRTSANSEPKSTAPANSGKVSQPATSNP